MIEIFDKFDELDERAIEQCVRRLSREVDEGKVEACWQLAALYEDGRGVERDLRRAFELREQGAQAGEPNAIVWLAYAYEHAVGTRYDLSKALELYERAIENFGTFRSRVFACCQTSIHLALRRAKSLSIQEKLVDGSTFYQTIVDVENEDKRARDIYEQCDPSADPLYCVELSYALRDLGKPKELSEEVASSLDDEAFVMLEKAVRRGNAVAMCKLADAYLNEDRERAIDLLRRAAEAGCAAANVKIGYLLEGEELDDDALEFYLKAAELDYPDGLCKAGFIYEKRGQTEEAVRLYRRGAQLGHAPSLYVLGNYCWSLTDDENRAFAVDCWRRSAESRFPFAMERYAEYLESELDENDSQEAWAEVAQYYKGAMDEGIDSSKVAYATMLYKGLGVDKDESEAARLFREIEESGDLESKEELAALKYKGKGCERDVEGAIRLLADAAEESVSAQIALGWQYFSGENVPVDEYRAARLIGKAAKSGAPEALAVFSRFCYEGRGVPRDDLAGEYFLRLAAEAGDPSSASRLGHMFADGDFGRPNWKLAAQWFQLASLCQDASATGRLAFCHWNGLGVPRDRVFGAFLWGLAEEYGDDEALEAFERAKLAFAVERLFYVSEDRLESLRNVELARSMKQWMETRTSENEDFPSRAEFLKEYKSRIDRFYNSGLKYATTSEAERFGSVDALLEMFGKCAAADAARDALAKGSTFEL